MSEPGLAAVLLMIGAVMLVMCYWKQIAIFLLFARLPCSARDLLHC